MNGSFCYVCGQRKQRRVASVSSLVSEYVLGILDWDSRIWRTLRPLFFQPGHLTRSYMEGKRERYSPPIRLYLISSIIFFLLISLAPKNFLDTVSSAINSQLGKPGSPLEMGLDSKVNPETFAAIAAIAAVSEELSVEIVTDANVPDTDSDESEGDALETGSNDTTNPAADGETTLVEPDIEIEPLAITLDDRDVFSVDDQIEDPVAVAVENPDGETATAPAPDSERAAPTVSDDAESSVTANAEEEPVTVDISDAQILVECEPFRTGENVDIAEFLRLPVYRFCLSVSSWRGLLAFMEELIESLPTTLLVLLPLMALVNKLFYLFARRYYVEHLLYYVHNYSFVFLFTVALVILSKLLGLLGLDLGGLIGTLGTLYVAYYFLKSLRVVYDQGRFFTCVKWLLLLFAFIVLAVLVLAFFTLATAAVYGL